MDNTTTNSEAGKLYEVVPKEEIPPLVGIPKDWTFHHSLNVWLRPYTLPAAPVREGMPDIDETTLGDGGLTLRDVINYMKDDYEGEELESIAWNDCARLIHSFWKVARRIEYLRREQSESPASPDRGEFDAEQSLRDAIHDFLHDGLKEQGYSTGSEEEYDKLYREIRRRADIAIESLQTGKMASSEQRAEGEDVNNLAEECWKTYRSKRLKTMGNAHLWKENEAHENFIEGFMSAPTTEFAEWTGENLWSYMRMEKVWVNEENFDTPTTSELYHKFLAGANYILKQQKGE